MLVICIVASKNFYSNMNIGDSNIELSKGNNTIQNKSNITEDKILFNDGYNESFFSYDAKWQETNLKDEFIFLNKIYIPEKLHLASQGKVFIRENINTADYSKLRQYSIIYSEETLEDPSTIEITFTKEKTIIGCLIPDENQTQSSIIDGKEVKLFKGEYGQDKSKISGYAFFDINGYKFYINAHKLDTEEDLINTVKSILKNFNQ